MAKSNALQKIESHEKLCRIMQKLTHKKIHSIEERVKRLEKILLQSPIVPWSFWASNFYYNTYWMQFIGKKRVNLAMKTEWGELFKQY